MPDVKISALPAAGTLDGTEVLPVVQGGVTKRHAGLFLDKGNVVHNVRAYGVVGDGVADDTAAIQSALDAAESVFTSTGRRQTVHLSGAKCRLTFGLAAGKPTGYAVDINACLRLRNGVDVLGPGELRPDAVATTTLTSAYTNGDLTLQVADTTGFGSEPGFGQQLQYSGTTAISSWTAKTATTFTLAASIGQSLPSGTLVSMRVARAVFVTDFANEVTDWSVRGVRINGGNTSAIEQLHETFSIGPSKRWVIADNDSSGMQGKFVAVIGEVGGAARIPERWVVARNVVRNHSGNAIGYSQAGAKDFKIYDNTFADHLLASGAEAVIAGGQTAIDRGIIRGNHVLSWGQIAGTGRDMVVSDNVVTLPAGALGPCIAVANGRNVKVVGNTLDASAAANGNANGVAATVAAVAGLVIANNTVLRNSTGAGIATQLSSGTHTDLAVVGNRVTGATGAAEADISVNQATDVVVAHNFGRNGTAINIKSGVSRVAVIGNIVPAGRIVIEATQPTVTGNKVSTILTFAAINLNSTGGGVCSGNHLRGEGTNGITSVIEVAGSDWQVTGNIIEQLNANQRWIGESGAANRNIFAENKMIGTSGNVNIIGAASRIRRNSGYVTEGSGSASVADAGTVSHGMSKAPTRVHVTPSVANRRVAVTALSATTFTVSLTDGAGTAITSAETVYWSAEG